MSSQLYHRWLVAAILLTGFLLSWRWAHAFSFPTSELRGIQFSTLQAVLDIRDVTPSCSRLRLYQKGESLEGTDILQGNRLSVAGIEDESEVEFTLLFHCQQEVLLRLPVLSLSPFSEKPRLVSSVSGKIVLASSINEEALFMRVPVGTTSAVMKGFFPSKGDRFSFDFSQIEELPLVATLSGLLKAGFSDQLEAMFSGTNVGVGELVVTNMFQPSLPSHAQLLVGCSNVAGLFFRQNGLLPCRLYSDQATYFPEWQARGKNFFISQANGTFTSISWPATSKPAQAGEVVITEVMWSSDGKWLELYNSSKNRFNLRGLSLIGAGSNGGTLLVNIDLFIEPYGYVVIGKSNGESSNLARNPDWITSSFFLSDTSAGLILRAQNGTELDRTPAGNWQVGKVILPSTEFSAQRQFAEKPGNDWGNWLACHDEQSSCDFAKYWKDVTTSRGTPWQPTVL